MPVRTPVSYNLTMSSLENHCKSTVTNEITLAVLIVAHNFHRCNIHFLARAVSVYTIQLNAMASNVDVTTETEWRHALSFSYFSLLTQKTANKVIHLNKPSCH